MKKRLFIGALLGALSVVSAPSVRASCGASGCPVDVHGGERTAAGAVRVDYSEEYIDQDRVMIGTRKAAVGEIPGHHDEVSTLTQTRRVGLEVGLTSRWSAQAVLPLVHVEHRHIHHHQGQALSETWDIDGVGDMTLLNRIAVLQGHEGRSHLSALAGAVVPTGRERATNADGEEADPGLQPGKGAYSLILGASAATVFQAKTFSGKFAEAPLFVTSTYQWNGKGTDDYRIGNTWDVNLGAAYPLLPRLAYLQQVNLRVNRRDDAGQTNEEVEKTGGTHLYVSPGLQVTMTEGLCAYALLQLPVYQRVNAIQPATDFGMTLGLTYRFSAL